MAQSVSSVALSELLRYIDPDADFGSFGTNRAGMCFISLQPPLVDTLKLRVPFLDMFRMWKVIEEHFVAGKEWNESLSELRRRTLANLALAAGDGADLIYNKAAARVALARNFEQGRNGIDYRPLSAITIRGVPKCILDYSLPVEVGEGDIVSIKTLEDGWQNFSKEDIIKLYTPLRLDTLSLPCPERYAFVEPDDFFLCGRYDLDDVLLKKLDLLPKLNPIPVHKLWPRIDAAEELYKRCWWIRCELQRLKAEIWERLWTMISISHETNASSKALKNFCLLTLCRSDFVGLLDFDYVSIEKYVVSAVRSMEIKRISSGLEVHVCIEVKGGPVIYRRLDKAALVALDIQYVPCTDDYED